MGNREEKPKRWRVVWYGPDTPPVPPYGPKEMGEDYKAVLDTLDGDERHARLCFEAYLAGRDGFMPPRRNYAPDDSYEFESWALSLIGARSMGPVKKKGADRGIDGVRYFMDERKNGAMVSTRMLVQVKGGHVKSGDIRDFVGTLSREGAEMGVFLSLEEPTDPMKAEAASAGVYMSPWDNKPYPKVQVLTVEELLADPSKPNPRCLLIPGGAAEHTLPVAPKHATPAARQRKLGFD